MLDLPALMDLPPPHLDDYNFFFGGVNQIELCGTALHLTKQGVPMDGYVGDRAYPERQAVTGSDGSQWEVWGTEPFALHARRARTTPERVRYIDHHNARVFSHRIPKDREAMCCEIAFELFAIVAAMASDTPMPRAARRLLKRKLSVLTSVQMTLFLQKADMPTQRQRLASIGLVVPQLSYFN